MQPVWRFNQASLLSTPEMHFPRLETIVLRPLMMLENSVAKQSPFILAHSCLAKHRAALIDSFDQLPTILDSANGLRPNFSSTERPPPLT